MQYKDFGKFIHEKRLDMGVSLNTFAIANNIEPATLCRIEKLQQDIKLSTIEKLAEGFNVSVSLLINEFESKKGYN